MTRLLIVALLAGAAYLAWLLRDDPIWHSHSRIAWIDGEWVQEARRP